MSANLGSQLLRVEKELRKSEERFKTMFNEAPLGIAFINSTTGHIIDVNPMFAQIAGRTEEQMPSIDWMSITHPDDIQEDLENMALMNAGKIDGFQMEKRYLKPDGTIVWVNMTIAPMNFNNKSNHRHLCMIEDITKRKQKEENLKKIVDELSKTNKELAFQNEEKEKRAAELAIANEEKEKRVAELIITTRKKKNGQQS